MTDSRVEVRLLGGFRVSRGSTTVGGFESQKVRALLAYLAVGRGRSFRRDHLAPLLWPEESDERARRNLRQAIYNLRRILDQASGGEGPIEVSRQEILLNDDPRLWLDVEAFERHLEAARTAAAQQRTGELAAAARLYAGDLLAGFHVDEALELEEWLIAEQERLREGAIGALLTLMEHHLERGTYSLGVEYGRRLTRIDPLSETARRQLMRLHAYSGRRSRAIAEYRELERLLAEELGVEPVEETTAEYRAILAEEIPSPTVRDQAEPVGPIVPLAGRDAAIARLREIWSTVEGGRGRLTLVTGESGIGKTRLIKTFLHEITRDRPALILQGRYHEFAPSIPYHGFVEALEDAVTHEVDASERLLAALPRPTLSALALLSPGLEELLTGPDHAPETPADRRREDLFEAVAQAFGALGTPSPSERREAGEEGGHAGEPVILFLDDLHAADPSSLELLEFLHTRLAHVQVWLLAAWNPARADRSGEPLPAAPTLEGIETIALGRLTREAVEDVAAALVTDRRRELAGLLHRCHGLPLAATELINLLWDEHHLVEHYDGTWSLKDPPAPDRLPADLEEIVQFRLSDLPTSTRRLFTLASVAGPEFDAGLLEEADQEHGAVVETGIRLLLERWMGRLRLGYWADSRKERDVSLWSTGPGRSIFEFSHPALRQIVYRGLDPERRAVLHRKVAETLELRTRTGSSTSRPEVLAFHYFHGRSWARAVIHLEQAVRDALRVRATPTAAHYCRLGLEALAALEREEDGRTRRLQTARDRFEALADRAGVERTG
ncbi:MAG: AAA family ATPase [Acidobacteriota bacterium]